MPDSLFPQDERTLIPWESREETLFSRYSLFLGLRGGMLRNGTQLETWPRCLNLLEPVCAHEITAVVTVTAVTGSTSATIAETIPWLLELPWICIQETRGDLSVALKFSTRTLRAKHKYVLAMDGLSYGGVLSKALALGSTVR